MDCTPPEIHDLATAAANNLLPEKSKDRYENQYTIFKTWCADNEVKNITENVVLAYMSEKSKMLRPSSLWSIYSMLKTTIRIKENITIENFPKVIAFLKKANAGYKPKKSNVLTRENINTFLQNAPNKQYLMIKVIYFNIRCQCYC